MSTLRGKFAALALVCVAALSACSSAQSTIVVATPTPEPTPIVVAVNPTPVSTPTDNATVAPTATPAATPAATPTATPAATPTPTATPSATPTSPALTCTGNDNNRAFFVESAVKLKFDVYCAILPKGWYMGSAKYELNNGGYFEAVYLNKAGNQVKLVEGNFCDIAATCAVVSPITSASFGDLSAQLYDTGASLLVAAKFGTKPAYGMHTVGATQADTLAWAAALYKVPKS